MKTCLVVDDSESIRQVERCILEKLNFSVVEAVNGRDALKLCRSYMPDIIILDDHMPIMNGQQFLHSLQMVVKRQQPKIIFCTTVHDMASILEAFQSGAFDYIIKPFTVNTVQEKVRNIDLI